DVRLALIPGENPPLVTPEGEIGFGIELSIGGPKRRRAEEAVTQGPKPDRDGDGIPDDVDKWPARPAAKAGAQAHDGCAGIDDDGDHIRDSADKCPKEPETYNGFEDEDGCPDTVPPDVDALKGTIEGLLYAEGETAVHDSAQPTLKKIAKVMADHPAIKV